MMSCRAIRVQAIEAQVLTTAPWGDGFRIWGAGRNGRQFYQQLSLPSRAKVRALRRIRSHASRAGAGLPRH